jgi:DNA primase
MRTENLDFGEALKRLALQTGVELPTKGSARRDDSLFKVNETAARYFAQTLASPAGKEAQDYLKGRGVSSQSIETFQLGLSPGDGQSLKRHLLSMGYNEGQQALTGLLTQTQEGSYQDLFRRRLMFPIWDAQGRMVGFGGRALDDSNPKYLNSRQGPIFDKSRILYAFNRAQPSIKERGAVVVEGYMDALVAHQEGFTNAVACMGTSLTNHQADIIKGVTQEIVLALDPDTAGQEATLRSLESSWQVLQRRAVAHSRGVTLYEKPSAPHLRVASLPHGKDPADLTLEDPSLWERITTEALPLMDFLFQALSARHDLSTAQGKAQVAQTLFPLVASITDAFEQDHHFRKLAQLLDVSEATLEASVGRPRASRTRGSNGSRREAASTPFQRLDRDPLEEHCLALLFQNPRLEPLSADLRSEHFLQPENREAFALWLKDNPAESQNQGNEGHYAYLLEKGLPPSELKEREAALHHCIQRLEERRLRLLKGEEALLLSQMDPQELAQYEENILEVNSNMKALFKSRSV